MANNNLYTTQEAVNILAQGTSGSGIPTKDPSTSNAARTSVTAATSDTSVLAANTSRTGVLIYNDSTAVMYLAYGATAASTTNYTTQIPAGGYWEMPSPIYTGALRAIWSAVNGSARVTELA